MGGRYWITGVQLGMLIVSPERQGRSKIVDAIIDKQFIGDKEDLKKMENRALPLLDKIFMELAMA